MSKWIGLESEWYWSLVDVQRELEQVMKEVTCIPTRQHVVLDLMSRSSFESDVVSLFVLVCRSPFCRVFFLCPVLSVPQPFHSNRFIPLSNYSNVRP